MGGGGGAEARGKEDDGRAGKGFGKTAGPSPTQPSTPAEKAPRASRNKRGWQSYPGRRGGEGAAVVSRTRPPRPARHLAKLSALLPLPGRAGAAGGGDAELRPPRRVASQFRELRLRAWSGYLLESPCLRSKLSRKQPRTPGSSWPAATPPWVSAQMLEPCARPARLGRRRERRTRGPSGPWGAPRGSSGPALGIGGTGRLGGPGPGVARSDFRGPPRTQFLRGP